MLQVRNDHWPLLLQMTGAYPDLLPQQEASHSQPIVIFWSSQGSETNQRHYDLQTSVHDWRRQASSNLLCFHVQTREHLLAARWITQRQASFRTDLYILYKSFWNQFHFILFGSGYFYRRYFWYLACCFGQVSEWFLLVQVNLITITNGPIEWLQRVIDPCK
jgi:mRNA-degrading endonuclease YafQ of YafQ-DinJ toxin-antitoxin module